MSCVRPSGSLLTKELGIEVVGTATSFAEACADDARTFHRFGGRELTRATFAHHFANSSNGLPIRIHNVHRTEIQLADSRLDLGKVPDHDPDQVIRV
jgi:hypothetical protein